MASNKSLNRVFLMGHLAAPPELCESKSGNFYTRLRLATNRYFAKERREHTDWHSVFVWGDLAEQCAKYLGVGAMVFVEGSLSYWRAAEDTIDSGKKGYKNAIHADSVRFISYGKQPNTAMNLDNHAMPRNHDAVALPAP